MKVWITKYALTRGILEANDAKICDSVIEDGSMINVPSLGAHVYFHGEGRQWHRSRTEAVERMLDMRDTKIKSLLKQIERLRKLAP